MTARDPVSGARFYSSNIIISQFADTAGDGTGTKNANGNYASAAEIFYIQPPAGAVYRIERLLVSAEDTGGMQAEEYGNLGSALTNGIELREQDDSGTITDLTDGIPVKSNSQWGRMCYDVDVKAWGSGNDLLVARWTFSKSGAAVRLRGDYNERLEVVLNDDLRGLISHYFLFQGNIE